MKQFYQANREIILYLLFGGMTTVVNYVAYLFFTRALSLSLVVSNVIAWALAVMFAYVTNRTWVFQSKASGLGERMTEFSSFVGARVFSGVVDTALMVVLVDWLSLHDLIAKIPVNVLVIVLNYILSKFFVFRNRSRQ